MTHYFVVTTAAKAEIQNPLLHLSKWQQQRQKPTFKVAEPAAKKGTNLAAAAATGALAQKGVAF